MLSDMGVVLSCSITMAIFLVPLYLIYKWVLSSLTFHAFNRVVLLVIYAVAVLIVPIMAGVEWLWALRWHDVSEGFVSVDAVAFTVPAAESLEFSRAIELAVVVYALGCVAMLMRSLFVWSRIIRLISTGEKLTVGDYRLVLTADDDVAPFSWCRYIVMSRDDYEQAGDMIVMHESRHLHLRHWIDLLLAESVIVVNWFNPVAWLLREELKTVHEYQADMAVLRGGVDARNYQLLLIKKAVGAKFPSLANSLNHSKLKKRITMMLSKSSSKRDRWRALALVPAVAVALLVVNQSSVAASLTAVGRADLMSDTLGKDSENSSLKASLSGKLVKIQTLDTLNVKATPVDEKVVADKDADIYVNGERVSREVMLAIDPAHIKSMSVSKGAGEIHITLREPDEVKVEREEVVVVDANAKSDVGVKPVFYIDGVRATEEQMKALNPETIKSISVSKDTNSVDIVTHSVKR